MIKFLDLHKQYLTMKDDIDNAISDVISSSAFIKGKYVEKFEEDFAEYVGIKYCIGVGNGTDAIEIAIEALNLPKNSEILVPANSFIATAEAVTRTGHEVVFCDCNHYNYDIDLIDIKQKITKRTAAIIVVHLHGYPSAMTDILKIAKENKIKVIEDCAQAHGAKYENKHVGTFGDIATFSFFPGKILGAYGDGGAIVTNNRELDERCRMISNHGRILKYNHEFEGRNSRLDGLQAAILSVKLTHLDEWITHRNKLAKMYKSKLEKLVGLPFIHHDRIHAYHLFVIKTDFRDELKTYLKTFNIETGVHYPNSLPQLPAYKYLNQTESCKFTNLYADKMLSLPIHENMVEEDVIFVSNNIETFLKLIKKIRKKEEKYEQIKG